MRLDHLLSKERLAGAGSTFVLVPLWVQMPRRGCLFRGWCSLVDAGFSGSWRCVVVSTALSAFGGRGGKAAGWGWGFVGTLLGPETTSSVPCVAASVVVRGVGVWCFGLAASVGIPSRRWWWGSGAGVGCGVGVLFENCTVDASIFVAKFLRAHGGCLGIRSR